MHSLYICYLVYYGGTSGSRVTLYLNTAYLPEVILQLFLLWLLISWPIDTSSSHTPFGIKEGVGVYIVVHTGHCKANDINNLGNLEGQKIVPSCLGHLRMYIMSYLIQVRKSKCPSLLSRFTSNRTNINLPKTHQEGKCGP